MNACCAVMPGIQPILFILGRGLSRCHLTRSRSRCIDQIASHELMDCPGTNEAAQCSDGGFECHKRFARWEPGGTGRLSWAVHWSRGYLRGLSALTRFKVIYAGTKFV